MANWDVWKKAYDGVTLRDDGDYSEWEGSFQYNLDKSFPNYEIFWRYHVVPSTHRPANLHQRQEAAEEVKKIGQLSHAIWEDLLRAEKKLELVRGGDLGGITADNCRDALENSGNAVQKFTTFQEAICGPLRGNPDRGLPNLAGLLGKNIEIFPGNEYGTKWGPERRRLIGYRNYLTHTSRPFFDYRLGPNGQNEPFVLKGELISERNSHLWEEQKALMDADPNNGVPFADVSLNLHQEMVAWLNGVYGEVIKALEPLLLDRNYQYYWGWRPNFEVGSGMSGPINYPGIR